MIELLRAARTAVVSGYKGRDVEVDPAPRCPACGRQLAEYLARPWSLRCRRCGEQCRSD